MHSVPACCRAGGLSAALVALAVAAGCQVFTSPPPLPVHHRALEETHYTAVNLRSRDGAFLRSSNDLSVPTQIPLGSPARVTRFTEDAVDLEIRRVSYTMRPAQGEFDASARGVERFLAKYFVPRKEALELDSLGPSELTDRVRAGRVLKGMTKAQVYAALGPPEWIGGTEARPTTRLPEETILESDRWTYTERWIAPYIPRKVTYSFREGKLTELGG